VTLTVAPPGGELLGGANVIGTGTSAATAGAAEAYRLTATTTGTTTKLRLYVDGASLGGVRVFPDLDLNGTFLGVWLAHTAFGLPLAVYLLRNYIGSLPSSIIESARIDGADHFTIFWRLIVPLSVPALAAFAIFQFLWVWNDLLVALLFLGPGDREVVTITVAGLVGSQNQGWQLLTAGAIISMLVPVLVFVSMQRFFVRGLTAGSVKG
jgi:alpha-glucoside transport system permease protein